FGFDTECSGVSTYGASNGSREAHELFHAHQVVFSCRLKDDGKQRSGVGDDAILFYVNVSGFHVDDESTKAVFVEDGIGAASQYEIGNFQFFCDFNEWREFLDVGEGVVKVCRASDLKGRKWREELFLLCLGEFLDELCIFF